MDDRKPRMTSADYGWAAIISFAVVHNVVAAGRRREMLSQACVRHRHDHPVIVPAIGVTLLAHLVGVAPWWADPLHLVGASMERGAELVRRCR